MNDFDRFSRRAYLHLLAGIIGGYLLLIVAWYCIEQFASLSTDLIAAVLVAIAIILALLIAYVLNKKINLPFKSLWQAIVHLSPQETGQPAPKLDNLKLGRELVTNTTAQIYQLASIADHVDSFNKNKSQLSSNFIANNLPLPLIVMGQDRTIVFANQAATTYLNLKTDDIVGQNVYSILDMSFTTDATLDNWLADVEQHSATAMSSWEHVRIGPRDQRATQLFDLAAYYNRDNPEGLATMLVLFDHTTMYSQDDQATSYVALAVHELRTPLTLLRGYIEVFEEEFAGKLTPELEGFMAKMSASAQQLATFVNNILNVARIDDDQMELQLQEHSWNTILSAAISDLSLRAEVRGIKLECNIAPTLPAVGIDRVSIYEVISNLVDNAIKYSGKSKRIVITSKLNGEGLIETSVKDFGVGIPENIVSHLFTKFYRNHRNRAQIGGTGLGLYLSRAIVTAHGGNIWINSKEGEGTTVSFTLLPYDKLAEETKNNDNKDIVRGAHGWIKNHSMYRR